MTPPDQVALREPDAGGDDEGMFGMANLRPERTGLPFGVFISQQGGRGTTCG